MYFFFIDDMLLHYMCYYIDDMLLHYNSNVAYIDLNVSSAFKLPFFCHLPLRPPGCFRVGLPAYVHVCIRLLINRESQALPWSS